VLPANVLRGRSADHRGDSRILSIDELRVSRQHQPPSPLRLVDAA
jgi:hypothetical protein